MRELVNLDIWKIQFVVWIRTKEVQEFIWELNYSIFVDERFIREFIWSEPGNIYTFS